MLELFITHPDRDLGVSEIARSLSIGRSTAHQILATLVAHGFVDQTERTARYRLGVRTIEAGAVAAGYLGLSLTTARVLQALVEKTGETCSIGAITGSCITLLQRVEAASVLRVDLRVGTRLPLHTSAIGRVLMSTMSAEAEARLLDELNLTPSERRDTMEQVAIARSEGCAIVRDIPVNGISAIAVPIHSPHHTPATGLVIAGPTFRFEPGDYREAALEAARSITARSTGRPTAGT